MIFLFAERIKQIMKKVILNFGFIFLINGFCMYNALAFPCDNYPGWQDSVQLIAARDQADLLQCLINNGKNFDEPNSITPLYMASKKNAVHSGEVLLKAGADPNRVSFGGVGNNPDLSLTIAADYGNIEMFELLLRYKANPNLAVDSDLTPMAHVLNSNYPSAIEEMVKLLVNYGVDVNAFYNNHRLTALISASYVLNLPIVEYLIQQGADVNAVSQDYSTPLFSVIEVLYENSPTKKMTAGIEIVKLLIKNGVNLKVKIRDETVCDKAKMRDLVEIEALFKDAGGCL